MRNSTVNPTPAQPFSGYARVARLVFPDVALHIIQRGNNRNACFAHDSDYRTYLSTLRQLSVKHECKVHAYCLMTNHVHLLLTPSRAEACGLLMRDLGRSYVLYFNRRHDRSGTLWEGYPLASEAFIASRLAPLGLRTQRRKPGPRVPPAELRT